MLEIISKSEADTKVLAQKIAHIAKKGDIFALYGTLGMGKSFFSRAFIQELTQADEVPSPTFTLLQTYEAKDFDIFHFDLYRLKSASEIFELGMEESLYSGVCLIEWPEKMGAYLPKNTIDVEISSHPSGRLIKISSKDPQKTKRLEALI